MQFIVDPRTYQAAPWDISPSYTPEPEELNPEAETQAEKFHNDVLDTFTQAMDTLLAKHEDYGPLNIARSPGGPLNGLNVRLWDKLARLTHILDSEAEPNFESLEDTFLDMANYALIGILVLRNQWPGVE